MWCFLLLLTTCRLLLQEVTETSQGGVLLLAGYMTFDAFTSQWQAPTRMFWCFSCCWCRYGFLSHEDALLTFLSLHRQGIIFNEHPVSPYQMMLGVNIFSALLCLVKLIEVISTLWNMEWHCIYSSPQPMKERTSFVVFDNLFQADELSQAVAFILVRTRKLSCTCWSCFVNLSLTSLGFMCRHLYIGKIHDQINPNACFHVTVSSICGMLLFANMKMPFFFLKCFNMEILTPPFIWYCHIWRCNWTTLYLLHNQGMHVVSALKNYRQFWLTEHLVRQTLYFIAFWTHNLHDDHDNKVCINHFTG